MKKTKNFGFYALILMIIILTAVLMTSDTGVAPFDIGGTLRILGIVGGVVLLYLIGMFVWAYIKHPTSKDPFGDGPLSLLRHRKQLKRFNEIIGILSENDPERFLREMDAFAAKEKLPKGMERLASDNRAVAYLHRGEWSRAIEIWVRAAADEKEARDNHKIHNNVAKATIHYNLAFAYLESGQVTGAEKHYAVVKGMQDAKYSGKALKAWIPKGISALDAKFLLAEGQYEAAREAYERMLEGSERPQGDVDSQFGLALIYEALGDTEKQKAHLEQVVAHGNKHDKARIAREKLAEMDGDVGF